MRKSFPSKSRFSGMTLIELLVTLSVLTILLLVGAPSFSDIMGRNRVTAYTNDFLNSLNYARSEAVTRGQRIVLCKSSDAAQCAASGNWEQGWITFVDADNSATVTNGDTPLRAHGPLSGSETLTGTSDVITYVSYSDEGYTRLTSNAFQSGTLSFSTCDNTNRTVIKISNTGRAHWEKESCS